MTAAEATLRDEASLIEAWRTEELERAGYTASEAAEIATRPDVDLHAATDLLARGCPSPLALRILL